MSKSIRELAFGRLFGFGYLAVTLAGLAGCSATPPASVSVGLLSTYDAAASAEIVALSTGKIAPAQATKLRADRVTAFHDIEQVVAAETAGGNTAALGAAAMIAVNTFLIDANTAKGSN